MKLHAAMILLLGVTGSYAQAQIDFTGEWDHPGMFGHEDLPDRGQGPEIGDYMGLPLNAAGVLKAETYSGSWLSVPEHQCTPHPAAYQTWGPNTLSVNKIYDRVQRNVIGIRLDGTFGLDRVVWMDGRSHPAAEALHTFQGFSTGYWKGDTLVVETSHLKAGWLRRNGTPTSERMKMTEFFQRFDDYLLVTTIVDDPVYLSEPFIRTTEYELLARPEPLLGNPFTRNDGPTFYKCFPGEETTSDKYYVPHYLPDTNDLLDDFAEKYHLPRWSMAAGGTTMYPEFGEQLLEGNVSVADPADVVPVENLSTPVHSMQVRPNIWVIYGAGGNIVMQKGDEGVLLVDTGSASKAAEVREEVRRIAGDAIIRYVINTHWHDDHTGGNVLLSDGPLQRAAVLANENVGLRLVEAESDASELIMDTYYSESKVIYFNGEAIEIIKVANAHTDGDSLVFFRGSDLVAAGGVIDTKSLPRFNTDEGGSIKGLLAALNRILDITVAENRGQGGTLVIPGNGRVYDEADVAEYRDMLHILRDRIAREVSNGTSLTDVKAANLLLDYKGIYKGNDNNWDSERFIEAAYRDLGGNP